MRDPPARNRPASCVNFNPKWGSYNARRIVTLAIVQSITICEPNLVIRYRANTSTLNHWLNTLLNILKIVVCECACIYICSANLALQILDAHSVTVAEASDPGKLLVSISWTEGNSV